MVLSQRGIARKGKKKTEDKKKETLTLLDSCEREEGQVERDSAEREALREKINGRSEAKRNESTRAKVD